jgi:hypothetical protein
LVSNCWTLFLFFFSFFLPIPQIILYFPVINMLHTIISFTYLPFFPSVSLPSLPKPNPYNIQLLIPILFNQPILLENIVLFPYNL